MLRCYTSRVEHGYTVPSVENLVKYAGALEVPLYRLFYEGHRPAKLQFPAVMGGEYLWAAEERRRAELRLFSQALSKMSDKDRDLLFALAILLSRRAERSAKRSKDRNPSASVPPSNRGVGK